MHDIWTTPLIMKKDAQIMEMPVSSFVNSDWSNMTDEEFMDAVKMFDQSEASVSWESLKSTDNVKIGKTCALNSYHLDNFDRKCTVKGIHLQSF